jgi:hypothetical protein
MDGMLVARNRCSVGLGWFPLFLVLLAMESSVEKGKKQTRGNGLTMETVYGLCMV